MCEFCNFKKRGDNDIVGYASPLLDFEGRHSWLRLSKSDIVYENNNPFELEYAHTHAERYRASINYCPICGRKLSEE